MSTTTMSWDPRAVPPNAYSTTFHLSICRIDGEYMIETRGNRSRPQRHEVVGSILVDLKIMGERRGMTYPGRLALDWNLSTSIDDWRPPRERAVPMRVFRADQSVGLALAPGAAESSERAWVLELLRKPPGRYRSWYPAAVQHEFANDTTIVMLVTLLAGGMLMTIRLATYGARAGARKCIACGYPIEKGTDRCPECGGLRPVWRNVGTKRE